MDILEPDPSTWALTFAPTIGERRLIAACLQRACLDYWSKDEQLSEEAKRYFEIRSMEPFQFDWICEVLGVDRKILRRKIELAHRIPFQKASTRYRIKFFNF